MVAVMFMLFQLEWQLSELEEEYDVKIEERDTLQSTCDDISLKLCRAETIIQSLANEQVQAAKEVTV